MSGAERACPTPGGELAPIALLRRALDAEFARDPRGPRAAALLGEYVRAHDDWRGFAHFAADCYTRNLVGRCAAYELLVLCWDAGAASPIHDHAGANCWMAVLEGRVEEVQYAWPASKAPAPMRATGSKTFAPGHVAFVNDGIALHLVRPADGRRAVSLHLYAPVIETCHAYDAATGAELPRVLTYHTAGGASG